jgi:hypothetical protein
VSCPRTHKLAAPVIYNAIGAGTDSLDTDFTCIIEPLACAWQIPPEVLSQARSVCDVLNLCLVPAVPPSNKIFGFAEFVQAFALLVLVYTMSDVRYRFRAATAPVPVWGITFWLSGIIGFGTLLTDLWFTNGYPILSVLSNQTYWQFAFGLLFVSTALLWLWYAYLRPPVFGRRNAERFARQVYTYVLQGAESDVPVIAAEMSRSAWYIVHYATVLPERLPRDIQPPEQPEPPVVSRCANDILLIIGSRKFCRHIVRSAPLTAMAFFESMSEQKKYRLPIAQFASNVSTEALLNKDSLLYHEDEGYYSGYLGYLRPFTTALYGDFDLVEALTEGNSPLDLDWQIPGQFDSLQAKAYCRAVLTTFESLLKGQNFYSHSYAMFRAFGTIESCCSDLYKLNEKLPAVESDNIFSRLTEVLTFINEAIKSLDKYGVQRTTLRYHGESYQRHKDYYDLIADLAYELIENASSVKVNDSTSWNVQHNAIWSHLFNFDRSETRKIILFKLRRRIYNEILSLERGPNFQNGAVLGFCLNVMGLTLGPKEDHRSREEYALRRVTLAWTHRNYLWLVKRQPKAAKAALLGTITFDPKKKRMVKTYIEGLSKKAPRVFLELDDARAKQFKPPAPENR